MRFEMSELQALRAVIEEGGFNNAAARLHITQSAVSQAIAGLENKLGSVLIERGKRPALTATGKRLFDYACETLRGEQQALQDIQALQQGRTAPLSLAMNSLVNSHYAPRLMAGYCKQYPTTTLQVQELPSRRIISAVASAAVELGFGPFQTHMPAFETLALFKERRHLVIGQQHPLASAVLRGDHTALQHTPMIASYLDEPDDRPGMTRIRDFFAEVWQVSSLGLRISMIDAGLGVAFMSDKLLQSHPACANFSLIENLPFSSLERDVGIYFQEKRRLSDSAQDFIGICTDFWRTA
ncbi:MAG: LysR family transcriptional regulator [Pseudomonadales bacterium]